MSVLATIASAAIKTAALFLYGAGIVGLLLIAQTTLEALF